MAMMDHELWKLYLGVVWIDILEAHGYHTLADLSAATDEELLAIRGMGPFKLRAIRKVAPYRPAAPSGEDTDAVRSLPDAAARGGQHQDG